MRRIISLFMLMLIVSNWLCFRVGKHYGPVKFVTGTERSIITNLQLNGDLYIKNDDVELLNVEANRVIVEKSASHVYIQGVFKGLSVPKKFTCQLYDEVNKVWPDTSREFDYGPTFRIKEKQ